MRALTYVAPRKVEWREVLEPRLMSDDDAIVQPIAVTRCDLDYSIVTGALGWQGPFSLGHEIAGVVSQIGDKVRHFRPADRVIVPFQISCGKCALCLKGLTGNCTTVPFRSSYGMAPLSGVDYGGALSDRVRVPFADHMLVACPPEVSLPNAAGLADQVTDAFAMVAAHLGANPGAKVLVVGGNAQGIGLLIAQAARALGASEVVYLDDHPARLAVARTLAITVVERQSFDGAAPGSPYGITIDANITPEALGLAIRSTDHGGVCGRTYGDFASVTATHLRDMYRIGVSLHIGRVNVRAMMPRALECLRCGLIHPDKVITRTVSFADAARAIIEPGIKVLFINEAATVA
jgi:threonine dehydrogenase-like Zn-dependent dehydrogenase